MRAHRAAWLAVTALTLTAAGSAPGEAQDGFLFGQPDMSATFRVGSMMPRAESQVFDSIVSWLTLDRGDFSGPAIGGEVSFAVAPRLDLSVGAAWAETETWSEFRQEFVDYETNELIPIEQVTRLRMIPISASAKFYPIARGRSVSSLAWLPARTTPYVGAGADLVSYRLHQAGDFVSLEDGEYWISAQDYESSGTARTLHARLGVDHWFSPTVGLNLEGRYTLGSAALDGDFQEFEQLDLTGVHAGVGLTVRW